MTKLVTSGPKRKQKTCGNLLSDGKHCRGRPVKAVKGKAKPDGKCLFHSKTPWVVERLHGGRILGGKQTLKRHILSGSLLGFRKIKTTSDLLDWLNRLNSDFLNSRVTRNDAKIFISIANSFGKILETKEIAEELQKLKEQVNTMEG